MSADWITEGELDEAVDDLAADDPLWALREIPSLLTAHRLDACALAEPLAALVYAYDLLTPERRAWCEREAPPAERTRYVPDRHAAERLRAILNRRGEP